MQLNHLLLAILRATRGHGSNSVGTIVYNVYSMREDAN